MTRLFLLARRSIAFHRLRSLVIVLCLAVTLALPVSVRLMVSQFQEQLGERAASTAMVIGPRGSRFDLVMHALYFQTDPALRVNAGVLNDLAEGTAREAIPLFAAHTASGYRVVGTTAEYLGFRKLHVSRGSHWQRLGDCLLGASVARALKLRPGDSLLSDPLDPFNLVGTPPLKMRVVGILAAAGSADDDAVFVSLKSSWLIEGIGHGHLAGNDKERHAQLSGALASTEVTEENESSFHFHGVESEFPLTAVLAFAGDARQATLLEARFLDPESALQLLYPQEVVTEMMELVFQAQQFFDLLTAMMGIVTVALLGLVIALSRRLRAREMTTMVKVGSSRWFLWRLQAAELGLLCIMAAIVAAFLVVLTVGILPRWLPESMSL